jgi:hypothetical protein
VKILNPSDPPFSACGAKIFDFDDKGRLIDTYFENSRAKTYVINPTFSFF